jgi:hypothetical protein
MKYKTKNFLKTLSILFASIISCTFSIYFIIFAKKKFNIENNHHLWILSVSINTFIIFTFLALFQLHLEKQKVGKINWNQNFKRNSFLLTLVAAKTLFWIGIISILTSEKENTNLMIGIIGLSLFICITLVHFIHTLMTKGIYKKYFIDKKIEKNNDDNSCKKIQPSFLKKIQYILCILFSCIIFALPMMLIRIFISYIPELRLNLNFQLFGKEVEFLNFHHNMLFICIIDCICLIFGFLLIGKLSDYLFIEFNKKFDKNLSQIHEKSKNQFKEKIIKNIDLDLTKEMFEIFSSNLSGKSDIKKIFNLSENLKEQNEKTTLILLSHYYFDEDKRNQLKIELNSLEKEINKIQDKNKKKIAQLAIQNFRKNFYIVTKKDTFRSNLFKASVSVSSTLCLHFLTHMHQSGAQFKLHQWKAILILAIISSIFLSTGLMFDAIAGNIFIGKDGLLKKDSNSLNYLKKNKDLWRKIVEWKEKGQNHKQRCGCESDGMQNQKNQRVLASQKRIRLLNKIFKNQPENSEISLEQFLNLDQESLLNMINKNKTRIIDTMSDNDKKILYDSQATLNSKQIEEILIQRDNSEPCECCCIDKILKQMLEKNNNLTEEEKDQIKIYLYEKELEKEIELKEMNNGGSCPCSNLAKADKKTIQDKLNELKIDSILWSKPISIA